jgi:hypothetical protein
MKIEKMSLKGIKNVLSRAEMKKIMAVSGGGGGPNCPPPACCEGFHYCPCVGCLTDDRDCDMC